MFILRVDNAFIKFIPTFGLESCIHSLSPVSLVKRISEYDKIGSFLLLLNLKSGPPSLFTYFHV